LAAAALCAQPSSLTPEIDELMGELQKISGLKPLQRVPWETIDKPGVKRYIEERIRESVKPEEIRAEEATLKKFGFAPPDFDLRQTTIDLLSEQAAAFYDYHKKKLYLVDTPSDMMQRSALVHELAHALADQHFHLEKFIKQAAKDDEQSLARMAVMEGQAMWLMSEYLTRQTGQSLKDSPVLLKLMASATEASTGQFPVLDRAPLYLRETLLFPYAKGLLFQHAVIEKTGQAAFTQVFERPPVSTQQILHPETYFGWVEPARPALPALAEPRAWRMFAEGEVGELDHAILIRQYASEKDAASVAPAWRGGAFKLMENKADKRLALLYASEWTTEEAARRFFGLYRKALQGKWKSFAVESESASAIGGRGDDGYFLLRRDGARVTSVEGLKTPADAIN
jgi:hypothetical protein